MERYEDFLERIGAFEKEELSIGNMVFMPNSNVAKKVARNNLFKSYFGDTVVFELAPEIKSWIADITKTIHSSAPSCFCEPLEKDTFHITLHDLSNAEDLNTIVNEVFMNEIEVKKILDGVKSRIGCSITMKTTFIFNMVSTSLVMGVKPATQADYEKLMHLYLSIDKFQPLPYPYTPHITLGYFNVHGFGQSDMDKLKSIVEKLNKEVSDKTIVLDYSEIFYMKFVNMNQYYRMF